MDEFLISALFFCGIMGYILGYCETIELGQSRNVNAPLGGQLDAFVRYRRIFMFG